MKKKIISAMSVLLITIIIAGVLIGCSQSTDDKQSTVDVPAGSKASERDVYRMGMTFELANPVWAELVQEAKKYGREKDIEVTYVDSKADAATQVNQIENFIQDEMDAIIVCAVEANALKDVLKKAQDAGVKVVGYTQIIENADAQYLVDAYNTGYACGKRAAKWVNENYKDQKIEWALMDLPIFPEIIDRANGIKDAMAEIAPNAKLVATASAQTAEDGLKNAESFLQANPDLKVICTIGGGGAVGGNEGVKSAGIKDFDAFGLFGIDATEKEIQNIINGDPQKSSVSLGGGKVHGRTLIDMAYGLVEGKAVEAEVYMPIEVIDISNAQEYWDEMYAK